MGVSNVKIRLQPKLGTLNFWSTNLSRISYSCTALANHTNVPIPKTDKFQLSNLFTIESSKYTDEEA